MHPGQVTQVWVFHVLTPEFLGNRSHLAPFILLELAFCQSDFESLKCFPRCKRVILRWTGLACHTIVMLTVIRLQLIISGHMT